MARKKAIQKRKKAAPKKCDASRKSKKRAPPKKPSGGMLVRNTDTGITRKSSSTESVAATDASERTPLAERVSEMGASHVAVAASASVVATGGSVYAVSKGWLSPKAASGVVMGVGVATTAAGYYWDMDHAMAAGVGMTSAGGVMLSGQYAVDWYQTLERRKAEREAKKKAKAQKKSTADQSKSGKSRRNARRIVIQPQRDPDAYDDEHHDESEYASQAA